MGRWLSGINLNRFLNWVMLPGILFCLCASPLSAQEGRKVLENPVPTYPVIAKNLNLSGVVKIEVLIGADGAVKEATVLGGHPLLADAALAAVRNWKYERAKSESKLVVQFRFHP
jgi:TonB family protein